MPLSDAREKHSGELKIARTFIKGRQIVASD